MRDFACPTCGQRLAFENSQCLHCGSLVGFALPRRDFALVWAGQDAEPTALQRCANMNIAVCNWLVPAGDPGQLCTSCALTRTRPADTDATALAEFAQAETAKRRLVFELIELGLPIVDRHRDPVRGLAFDLLSSTDQPVTTGHSDGVITLDLAEGDDVHREQLRTSMDEPYRTLLGHFRHEIGHYYFTVLAQHGESRREFERLFGQPDSDYQAAIAAYYDRGAPDGWQEHFVSAYATMHPAEDWAETFAHYLHIRDTVDTAAAFGFAPAGVTADRPLGGRTGFDHIIGIWLPLSWSLNMMNRSMGRPDLYPFILPPAVLTKMALAHDLIASHANSASA